MKKLSFLLAFSLLLGCSHNQTAADEQSKSSIVPIKETKNYKDSNNFSIKSKPLNKDKGLTKQSLDSKPKPTSKAINSQKESTESTKSKVTQKKDKVLLDVPLIKQNPELKYGCEVTSLTMVLQYAGVQTDKMDLFEGVKKDRDPLVKSNGDILKWGDPGDGFVGDMTGNKPGYAVFDKPITDLVDEFLPGRAINLTNRSFDEILNHVSSGYPVVVWTTGDYRLPDRWESWKHGNKVIKTPLDLHAVVLVGYDKDSVYLNDPLSGKKQVKVSKERFISSWEALKCRAVSYM